MKYLLSILLLCLPGYAADVHLGSLSALTWTGTGADRVASFAAEEGGGVLVTNIGVYTNTQDFTGFTNGYCATNGWIMSLGTRASTVTYQSAPIGVRFFTTTGQTDPTIQFPLVTNGMYYLEYYTIASGGAQLTNAVSLQRSDDGVAWTNVWELPHTASASWVKFSTNILSPNQGYFRFFCPGQPVATSYYFDDVLWTSYTIGPP